MCLQEQRSRIREFAQAKAERDGKQADEGPAAYSKADLDAMWAEVSTLRAERDTLKGIVDSLKKPLEEHTAAADELWKKKSDKRREYVRAPPLTHPVVAAYLSSQAVLGPSKATVQDYKSWQQICLCTSAKINVIWAYIMLRAARLQSESFGLVLNVGSFAGRTQC